MRTLKGLGLVRNEDLAKFPFGGIKNKTTTEEGTPVVEEVYNDLLQNFYAILSDAGLSPNEIQDNKINGYQLLKALKVFYNDLNDLQQTITVNNINLSLLFDFDNLPDNYVFIGKVTEDILPNVNYSLTGIGNDSYTITSESKINASGVVICVLNSQGSKLIGLASIVSNTESLHTSFGSPLSFNDSDNLYYYESNLLTTEFPKSYDLQSSINDFFTNSENVILDVILFKGKLLCSIINQNDLSFKVVSFNPNDFTTVENEINIPDTNLVDNQPYMYCDGSFLYFSNTQSIVNDSINNYDFGKFSFDEVNNIIALVSSFSLNSNFEKTTNVFINSENNKIYTFVLGNLYSYDLNGTRTIEAFLNADNGVVFKYNNKTYYTNGNIAVKWNY